MKRLVGTLKNVGPGTRVFSNINLMITIKQSSVRKFKGEPGGSKLISAMATVKNMIASQSGFLIRA